MKLDRNSNTGAASGMLLIAGALMYEWRIPISKAVKGLRYAYKMEKEKVEKREKRLRRPSTRSAGKEKG